MDDAQLRIPEAPEAAVPGWWWQVLGADSSQPVMGAGRADRERDAKLVAEAQMAACEGTIGAIVLGPSGVMHRCRLTVSGAMRWTAAE